MEPLFRIAIVENEPADAEKLHALLDRYFQEVKESFSIDTYGNAFDFIEDAPKYNLVFMDIEMPGITGMEASFKIRESNESLPLIIFVTNMAQFAIDGYKVSALDFCLKPITYEDLFIPMEKARNILQLGKERYYIVKTKTELIKIPVSKIIYIEMVRHDIHVHYVDDRGEEKLVRHRGSMKDAEKPLAGSSLVRVNSGCLINSTYFSTYNVSEGTCQLKNGTTLVVSRSNRKSLLDAIAKMNL